MSRVIKFIYAEDFQKEDFKTRLYSASINLKSNVSVLTYNESHHKEKREAIRIKASCGARKNPFIAVYENKELVKAFYTEAEDVVQELINYLKCQES